MEIKFGTSGWRAVIADDFTFENVRRVSGAIFRYLKNDCRESGPILIGFDTRFMGEKFAQVAANLAIEHGFDVLLAHEPIPTPVLSFSILSKKAIGAINFTASHNPPEYQGIKFSTSNGAPALPEVTKSIESYIRQAKPLEQEGKGSINFFDPKDAYFTDLKNKIDFSVISKANGRYAFEALWGTGRGYLDRILESVGCEVTTLHNWRDVTFGGLSPEPGEKQLTELTSLVKERKLTLGLATDGDADRFGVVDSDGSLIEPNKLIALLADYLVTSRGWRQGLARSVATTHLVDRVAALHGLELFETPVGFKYIGELIMGDQIVIGGEESAGLSIRGHLPEKDGILACLLAAEAVAARGASISEQVDELFKKVGRLESKRIGLRLDSDLMLKLKNRLKEDPKTIGKHLVKSINRLDGVKFLFEEDAWLLIRPSGTEPVVRIYAEAKDSEQVEELIESGKKYLLQ
jgi:phosphoglucomutase